MTDLLDASACPSIPEENTIETATAIPTGLPSGAIDTLHALPTCIVESPTAIDILANPSNTGKVVEILPAGTELKILAPSPQANGLWFCVSAHDPLGYQISSFVIPNNFLLPSDCAYTALLSLTDLPSNLKASFTPTPAPLASALTTPTSECNSNIGADSLAFRVYTSPGYDAPVLMEISGSNDPNTVTWLSSTLYSGSTWYYVRVTESDETQEGWVTEDQFNTKVTCALLNRGEHPTPLSPDTLFDQGTTTTPTFVPTQVQR